MNFNDLVAEEAQIIIDIFANCTVTARLHEVETAAFRAIFDDRVDFSSPFEVEQLNLKPGMTALAADIDAASGHSFDILRDGETAAKSYSFDGKPRPSGPGLTLVPLAVKR